MTNLGQFSFNLPVNLLFGSGVIEQIGKKAAELGKKALIVTGKGGSAKKSGVLDTVTGLLKASGVDYAVFAEVEPNPTTDMIYSGVEFQQKNGCDFVIGLGGGSMIDAAKNIAFMAKNSGDLMDYVYGRKPALQALPLIAIPTTCGTGSEGNGFAVVTDSKTGDKKSLRSNAIIARVSIIDPNLMKTMPAPVLASVGFDALCHCMEAYVSAAGNPLTDSMSLQGMSLVGESLAILVKSSDRLAPTMQAPWEKLTLAATLGGMAIGIAGCTAPHGLEHPASGKRNIVHGRGLAALTPIIMEKSILLAQCEQGEKGKGRASEGALQKYAEIARRLGGTDEHDCVACIKKLLADIDLVVGLGEQGILESDIPWMAENALKVAAAGMKNHPVEFSKDEIAAMYRAAM